MFFEVSGYSLEVQHCGSQAQVMVAKTRREERTCEQIGEGIGTEAVMEIRTIIANNLVT